MLDKKRNYEITTLNGYINLLKKECLLNYYFRGENDKYKSIQSSLLRYDNSEKNIKNYTNLVNTFYDEIAVNIGVFERKEFLAFSQHHGLPTNLVDITTSPLVALFFACWQKRNEAKNGYIYLFDKENCFNITDLINKFILPPSDTYNILKFLNNNDFLELFIKYLNDYFYDKNIDLTAIVRGLRKKLMFITKEPKSIAFINDLHNIAMKGGHFDVELYNNILYDGHLSGIKIKEGSLLVYEYVQLLLDYFGYIYWIDDFPPIPYCIYKTPYKFDRIRNQEGLFIYQLYNIKQHYEDKTKINKQVLLPDVTISVYNQDDILKELDFIGINQKYIFGDYDNIARYITSKYIV